jgi:hypothetical protein
MENCLTNVVRHWPILCGVSVAEALASHRQSIGVTVAVGLGMAHGLYRQDLRGRKDLILCELAPCDRQLAFANQPLFVFLATLSVSVLFANKLK